MKDPKEIAQRLRCMIEGFLHPHDAWCANAERVIAAAIQADREEREKENQEALATYRAVVEHRVSTLEAERDALRKENYELADTLRILAKNDWVDRSLTDQDLWLKKALRLAAQSAKGLEAQPAGEEKK